MKKNTIKIKKLFYSFMKEKIWLEEKALEGLKLRNITLGFIYEFERIEPTRLVYEIERFDLPANPTLSDIQQKEQFMEMAAETGWEVISWDESLNYYLCKPYDENGSNELYNDQESRKMRATRFRNIYLDLGHSLLGFSLAINVIMLLLCAIDNFRIDRQFTTAYLIFTLIYTIFCISIQYIYRKIGNDVYSEFCMSEDEWKNKYDYTKENVKKCKKIIVRGRALVKYLDKQAQQGWYLSAIHMFSYTFTRENPLEDGPIYYAIEDKNSIKGRLKESGLSLEKNYKDINNLGFEWLEQSVKAADNAGLQYISSFNKRIAIFATKEATTARTYQKSGISVGWMSYGFVWFCILCALLGGILGFISGFIN